MKDKLDILVGLINDSTYSRPFENMLKALSNDSEAFLFLYDSLPQEVRPNFKKCTEHFKQIFIEVISEQDEKTFNNYFFSGIHEEVEIEDIRKLHFKHPKNEKLTEYLKTKDNPKNMDEIVLMLSQLWEKKSPNYKENFDKFLPKLYKIAQIKSKKSRAADYFATWGAKIIKRDGFEKFFKFCESIRLEPYSFCDETGKDFGLEPRAMKIKDLQFLINYGEKLFDPLPDHKTKHSYQVIQRMSRYAPIMVVLTNISREETPENIERFSLLWNTQEDHIKQTVNRYIFNTIDLNKTDTISVIKQFVSEKFEHSDRHQQSNLSKQDFERIISWGNYATMQTSLPLKDEAVERKKLKL